MKQAKIASERGDLLQLTKEQLMDIILSLAQRIEQLEQHRATDSQTSSKPASTDLLRKSEQWA
jgi:hypothetical protein